MGLAFLIAGLSFIFIFISGTWLNRTGKPYSMLVITVHKLIGLAVGGYLVMTIYRVHRAASINPVGITAILWSQHFFSLLWSLLAAC
jgi:NADH:ubiquinone oxidoreductase subunit K